MNAAWAAVLISVVLALGAVGRELLKQGIRQGKIDAILERLVEIAADHEIRIRANEKRR